MGAFGLGASGSSIIRTRLLAPLGTPSHASGGETSSPSQVYLEGIIVAFDERNHFRGGDTFIHQAPNGCAAQSSGKYCRAPLLYAGAILEAFRRISFTVASVSPAPRFHLCACMKSSAAAGPGIRSEVGAVLGFLCHALAASGLGFAPRSGLAGATPNRFLVCCNSREARSLASCLFRYSDFTQPNLG